MKSIILFLVLCCGQLFAADTITGTGKQKPKFLGLIPYGSHIVEQPVDPDDSIGSLIKCMDKVHKRGGGTCANDPKTIKAGKHNLIYRKYEDVIVVLK